jgi:hypothetical protein
MSGSSDKSTAARFPELAHTTDQLAGDAVALTERTISQIYRELPSASE